MDFAGNILKMRSGLLPDGSGTEVYYHLRVGSSELDMNALLGKSIRIEYSGKINCIYCGRSTRKSFAQGYCYPCFVSLPQTDVCILHPEKCEAHLGISRDMSWAENNCLADHIVYLALTPGLKVGVTRVSQIPTRWIDQGAWEAIILARTPNRVTAGRIEVFLKGHLSDKTNWRKMLSGERNNMIDLRKEKGHFAALLPGELSGYVVDEDKVYELSYPVVEYPQKIKSLNLDNTSVVEGVLSGIKGQYLLFKSSEVLNIRKHGGYYIELSY